MSFPKSPYGACAHCRRIIGLNGDGMLRRHAFPRLPGADAAPAACLGSWGVPGTLVDLAELAASDMPTPPSEHEAEWLTVAGSVEVTASALVAELLRGGAHRAAGEIMAAQQVVLAGLRAMARTSARAGV